MARLAWLFLLVSCSAPAPALAQEAPAPVKVEVRTVLPGTRQLARRLLFVVDASISMDASSNGARALAFVRETVERCADPSTQVEVAWLVFGDAPVRYPTTGYVPLLQADRVEAGLQWLAAQPSHRTTLVDPALRIASAESSADPEVSVVLVTDGGFGSTQRPLRAWTGPGALAVYGVSCFKASDVPILRKLAERGGGVYVHEWRPTEQPLAHPTPWVPPLPW